LRGKTQLKKGAKPWKFRGRGGHRIQDVLPEEKGPLRKKKGELIFDEGKGEKKTYVKGVMPFESSETFY